MSKLQSCKTFLAVLNKDALVFLAMRLSGIIMAVAAICLLCRASTVQRYFDSNAMGQTYDMMPLGPLAFSMVWAIASLILPGCRRKYHPGLDVALDLLALAVLLPTGVVLLSWAVNLYDEETCREFDPAECADLALHLAATERTASILVIMVGLTHGVMFIRACIAVHARRKQYVPSRNSFMRLEKSKNKSSGGSQSSREESTTDADLVTPR